MPTEGDPPSSEIGGPPVKPGWYPNGDGSGAWRWWNGSAWVDVDAVGLLYRPPTRRRVVTLGVLAAVLLVATIGFVSWGYVSMDTECRKSGGDDTSTCVSDSSMGVDMIGAIGLAGSGVLIALAVRGQRRRRRFSPPVQRG